MNAEKTAGSIARWLRDYAANCGKVGYVVGISGGVDSAVAAALAVRGAGKDNVFAMVLPCHSDWKDWRLGKEMAAWLGIAWEQINLAPAFESLAHLLGGLETGPTELVAAARLAEANIKPRLRMIALYYVAAITDCLVLGTSNLSERMLGYFTKYGDGGVDVEPLGQLYKTEVWELAKYLGVPQEIIARPPSAGLWPGQTDEGEIGFSYAEVDMALTQPQGNTAVERRVIAMNAAAQHKLFVPPLGPRSTQ